nr:unnamed protein product [Callosobruchus analis]
MHSLFIKENPELQHTVKYESYLKYFKENYALRFGRPQVDACSECERLRAKIIRSKSLNANAKRVATAELIVHKRHAQKFYKKLQNVQKLCQERPDVAGITFDFIQNLPLPNIPVQEIFYFRQLWVYAFEIHNLSDNTGHFYTYHEATKRFKKIFHYFPVRGHSFLPCDRDFGILKKLIRRCDRIYIPEEYQEVIASCRKNNSFTFKEITYKYIIDFKNWWPTSYKKTASMIQRPGGSTETFTILKYRQFVYDSSSPGYVTTYEYIDGFISYTFKLLKQNKPSPALPEVQAYQEPVPINHKKIVDIKKVMKYIHGETLEFYYHITSWKQSDANEDAD